MSRTLNELIRNTIFAAEDEEENAPVVSPPKIESHTPTTGIEGVDLQDVEKLASALEFVGRRGVATLLEKEANTAAIKAPPGTNENASRPTHTQKLVGPHAGAPPMSQGGHGPTETNAKKKPGGGSQPDTGGKETGTHHPGLASNQAAINLKGNAHVERVTPALRSVLDTKPFADGKARENLSHAAQGGEPNTHSKKASEHDIDKIRAELARRVASAQQGAGSTT